MAIILNLPNCGGTTGTFNSGIPLCDVTRKTPRALYLMDSGVEFDDADMATIATFVAALKTKTRNPRGNRVYPMIDLSNYESTTTEAQKGALGNLSTAQVTLNDAIPSFRFEHHTGDLFHQQLVAAQNANLKLMILDSAYNLYGTKTAGGKFTGYSLAEFYAELPTFATASEVSKYPFSVTLASLAEIKENLAFIQLDGTVLNVKGNIDVTLVKVSQAANVINVQFIGRGGKNLGDLYPTQLASINAIVITNAQTNAAVTETSVSYNSAGKYFVITADSTVYNELTVGQKFNVDLETAANLSALGVDGFESTGPVQIVRS